MTEQTPEQVKKSYFKVKTTTVEHMKELLHDIKWSKHDELKLKIIELETELENLKNTKKYWLVWDSEKCPEQVVLDYQNKLSILKEIKEWRTTKVSFETIGELLKGFKCKPNELFKLTK